LQIGASLNGPYHCLLATYYHTKEVAMMMNKCTSVVGHIDGHAQAWVQYGVHQPIKKLQGFA
jgi:hypothetical protein